MQLSLKCKSKKEKKNGRDEKQLLPLMRVPVTSLCSDTANLTSPCLQRLAQPVILPASRDTAGSAQPQRRPVRASPPSASRLFFLSPLAERNKLREERALSELRRLSPCRAAWRQRERGNEGEKKKQRSGDLTRVSLPCAPPLPFTHLPLRQDPMCVTKLVTA